MSEVAQVCNLGLKLQQCMSQNLLFLVLVELLYHISY